MLTAPVFKWMMMGRTGAVGQKKRCSKSSGGRPTGQVFRPPSDAQSVRVAHHQAHAGAAVL